MHSINILLSMPWYLILVPAFAVAVALTVTVACQARKQEW